MGSTRLISQFCADTSFEDLPSDVVDAAKLAILDALGCAVGSRREEPSRIQIIGKLLSALGIQGGKSTLIGEKGSTTAAAAAFANGILCHSIDFDDLHAQALTHTSCVVMPAALATAEERGLGGRELITSFILGYEVAVRIGMAVMPSHYDYWHSTATNGIFGATVAAGKNYSFSSEQFISAIGFGATQSAGLLTYLDSGDFSKSLNPGKAAFNGVLSAQLVQAGAQGPAHALEHAKGYISAYSKAPGIKTLEAALEKLGWKWELLENILKPFPSLTASHNAMEITLGLTARHDIHWQDVERIVIRTYSVVRSHFSNFAPSTVMAARLSVPYCVAACVVTRTGGLDAFRRDVIHSEPIRSLLGKIDVVADTSLDQLYPELFPCEVQIQMKDAQIFSGYKAIVKGSSKEPFSMADASEKFEMLAEPYIGKEACKALVAQVKGLERLNRVSELTQNLRQPG